MKKGTINPWVCVGCAAVVCCCIVHRNVIKAVITGTEMPKAPKWHIWVPKDKRREG